MHIFLDESGDFTRHDHEEYFVVASFTVGDQRRTKKAFRKWFSNKFPKRMCTQSEIKWSASGIDDQLRLRTVEHIAQLDTRIRYGFLKRINVPTLYRNKRNKIDSGRLYTTIVAEVLEGYLPVNDKDIHIYCDRRSLKGMTRGEFESAIREHLLPLCVPGTMIRVEMIDSTTNENIQIADWIAGAIKRYLEGDKLGGKYYGILKNNFLEDGKEFFREL